MLRTIKKRTAALLGRDDVEDTNEIMDELSHVRDSISEVDRVASSDYSVAPSQRGAHKLREAVRNNVDMEELGSGRHRTAFALSDEHVIKVGGPKSNRKEVEAWETAPDNVKEILCPILDYDDDEYKWIVMERAEDCQFADDGYDVEQRLRQEVDERGMDVIDLLPKNVGRIGDREVILDYAEFYGYYDPESEDAC